jgi:hypothetical protein
VPSRFQLARAENGPSVLGASPRRKRLIRDGTPRRRCCKGSRGPENSLRCRVKSQPKIPFPGSIILGIFLVCAYAAGRVLSRARNARFARAWEPLRPVVGGNVVGDGGGTATGRLSGTYKGRSVRAPLVPNRNRYSGETGFRYHYFDVALLETRGKSDWSLRERRTSADKALEQRLYDAGAMARARRDRPRGHHL